MEIDILDDRKLVEIWLTNSEKDDEQVNEQLKPLCKEYKEKKYLVVVFKSGTRNLADATSDLLCYNRKRMAELEVQRKRKKKEADMAR